MKNKNKIVAKVDILLNLKYSDLSKPLARQQLNDSELQLKNTNNVFTNIKSKFFCGNSRLLSGGCKCESRCMWVDKWMKLIRETKWSD